LAGSKLNPQLGDAHLDPKEEVARQREELLKDIAPRKAYGQEELDKAERSEGPRLYYSVFLRKLKKIYPQLLVKDGIPGNVALYRPKTEGEIIRDGYDLAAPRWYNEHKYFAGFPKDHIPEWGHYVNDTDGIAEREVRGWRTVLIAFIKQGVLTYQAVVGEFGDPANDQRSRFWFEQLQEYMNEENKNVGRSQVTIN
jgi:hypothetical protein